MSNLTDYLDHKQRSTIRGRLQDDRMHLEAEIASMKRQIEAKQRLVDEINALLGDREG